MTVISNPRTRAVLRILLPFVMMPLLVYLSAAGGGKEYYAFSLAAAVLSLLLFISGFEKRSIGSRRLVIVAVMTSLCVAGRFIPFFKPVTALCVLTALYLGGEAGFLTGALAALVSDFGFGMGPWTPFQMLAWGLTGLFAGYLATLLKKHLSLLLIYGALSGAFFSLVMDVWTVLWYNGSPDAGLYLAAIVTAVPHTLLYSVSNFLFLWVLARPVGEKLERIRIKYGI